MSSKFQQPGEVMDWTNNTGSDVVVDQLVVAGNTLGVALANIADGARGPLAIEGVFSGMPKVSAAVFEQGEKLIFDVSENSGAGAFDDSAASPASGDVTGGAIAWAAGADTEVVCTIKLTPGNTTVAA